MNPTPFFLIILFYQTILATRDFTVTGIIAKGLPPDWRFHTYAIATTLEVTVFATYAFITEPVTVFAVLKAWTILLCWIGGLLDWIYFAINKLVHNENMPSWDIIWYWMPKIFPCITKGKITLNHPTTRHWLIYTVIMWGANITAWTITLGAKT